MSVIHPVTIRGIEIASNVFFAPINPGKSAKGLISDDYISFFTGHAGREIGICYVGNVAIQKEWSSNASTAVLSMTPDTRWIELSAQIKARGSLPGIQLAWKPPQITLQRSFITGNKAGQVEAFKKFYCDFEDVEATADLFINSIEHAVDLGFSVVQIHAAHGYALSLLLSRAVSGCDTPEETKGVKLIKRMVNGLNISGIILDIRLSLYEGIEDDLLEMEYKTRLIEILLEYGFDMISLSNGFYNIDKTMIYPSKKEKPVILEKAEHFARKYTDSVWNVAGNMENILMNTSNLPYNLTFSLGRQLLVDPDTVVKIKRHTYIDIQLCSECNECHYYSFGFNGIQGCKSLKDQ